MSQVARDGVLRKQTERRNGQRVLEQDYGERGTLIAEKRWSAGGGLFHAIGRESVWVNRASAQNRCSR